MIHRVIGMKPLFGAIALLAVLASGCASQPPAATETPAAAPAPAAQPAAQPVAPAPAAPAPKAVTEKATFSSTIHFDFDKAVIRPDAKPVLDELIGKVKDIALEVIIAVGHADRIGTDEYNQRLSVRRAEAVKAYLVSRGIQANRVYTEGKGEKQPVTRPDDCKGMGPENAANTRLIECLQPDRRADIEVVGARTVTR